MSFNNMLKPFLGQFICSAAAERAAAKKSFFNGRVG